MHEKRTGEVAFFHVRSLCIFKKPRHKRHVSDQNFPKEFLLVILVQVMLFSMCTVIFKHKEGLNFSHSHIMSVREGTLLWQH